VSSAGSPAGDAPLVILDRRTDMPLFRQVHKRLRAAILSGELPPGARLPASRTLAAQLAVSRPTVQEAYDMLAAEGYVIGRGARGTMVAPSLTPRPNKPRIVPESLRDQPAQPRIPLAVPPPPFQMGLPALDAFPRKLWSRLAGRAARTLALPAMVHQPPGGLEALRRAIAAYLAIARGVVCTPDQVIVTAGYQGALALLATALLRPGDPVWIENPGYFMARDQLAMLGAALVPVPVDASGLQVEQGTALAPRARLALVTPSHQFPTGNALTLRRRLALIDWARAAEAWIVEDDYDSEYRYLGRPLPALHGHDPARVLYVGTFSKVLFPSLRLGYLVAPPDLVERLLRARTLLDGNPAMLDQTILAAFMAEGHLTRHINRMRRLYAQRRAALVEAVEAILGDAVRIEPAAGGMHLLLHLSEGRSDLEVMRRAQALGLGGRALSSLHLGDSRPSGLLLSFTNVPAEAARREVARLRQAVLG
jgi:GntR family transcriptional regulator/MocR family aminotransferase